MIPIHYILTIVVLTGFLIFFTVNYFTSNDCSKCANDCSKCANDCSKCSNDCSKCSNDCSKCPGKQCCLNSDCQNNQTCIDNKCKGSGPHPTPSGIVTMVWSGSSDWTEPNADIVALASALPSGFSDFQTSWASHIASPQDLPTPDKTSKKPKTHYILSIGGSNASVGGWTDMATSASLEQWTGWFTNLFKTTGMDGIDWDLENMSDNELDFVGKLSTILRQSGYFITITVFGNKDNPSAIHPSFFTAYPDSYDYVPIMLYGSEMWIAQTSNKSWCQYAKEFFTAYPSITGKIILALYPSSGDIGSTSANCCSPCIEAAVDMITTKEAIGIALWAYGGYLGDGGMQIKKPLVAQILKGLKETPINWDTIYPNCKGPLSTNGCA